MVARIIRLHFGDVGFERENHIIEEFKIIGYMGSDGLISYPLLD